MIHDLIVSGIAILTFIVLKQALGELFKGFSNSLDSKINRRVYGIVDERVSGESKWLIEYQISPLSKKLEELEGKVELLSVDKNPGCGC